MTKKIEKRSGRPATYNHEIVLKHLRKYEGQQGGMKKAHTSLAALKAFAGISYATICSIAKKNNIRFGLGKPKVKKNKKKEMAQAA